MQIDFQKEHLSLNETVASQTATLLVEGDVIVPDIKPDISEVLLAEATTIITEYHLEEGKLHYQGVATVKILYIPDGEGVGPKSIDTKLTFKDSIEIGKDGDVTACVKAVTEHVEFSLINSRKLNVRVVAGVSAKCYKQTEAAFLSEAPAECPLQLKKNTVSAYQIIADTSGEVVISETVEIPAAKPDADEIIKLSVKALRGDCKLMSGKMIVKGALMVYTLYQSLDPEDGLHIMEHEIPFSEILEVPGLDDTCLCNVSYEVKDVYYLLKDDANGDPRAISLDVVLHADVMASKIQEKSFVEDCYSLSGREEVTYESLQLDELLCEGISHLNLKEILTVPEGVPAASAVYSLDCKPKVQELLVKDDKLVVRGKLGVIVLYGSAGDKQPLYSLEGEFDFEHAVPAQGADDTTICECGVTDQNISFTLNAASEIELRSKLEFYTRVIKRKTVNPVTACEILEGEAEPEGRGLVIYFAQKGDSLWDVSKHYRVDRQAVMKLNQMDGEQILAGQKILIPRV